MCGSDVSWNDSPGNDVQNHRLAWNHAMERCRGSWTESAYLSLCYARIPARALGETVTCKHKYAADESNVPHVRSWDK